MHYLTHGIIEMHNLDLEAVCWFIEVINQGSFIGAAKKLDQPSSNVSRRIARLEKQLGCKLLLRTTRSIALSNEGQEFLPIAQQLVKNQQDILSWAQSRQLEPTGTIKITAPGGFARWPLADWILLYKQRYPKVKITLISSNDYLDFQQHQLDFAFRQGPLTDSSLIAQPLFDITYGVFATPKLLAQLEDIIRLEDLYDKPVITTSAKGKALPWFMLKENISFKHSELMFEDTALCLRAALESLGLVYLSYFEAADHVKSGELVNVLKQYWPKLVGFYLMSNNRLHKSKKNQVFLDLVNEQSHKYLNSEGIIAWTVTQIHNIT